MYGRGFPDHGLGIFFTDNLTMAKWFAGLSEYDAEHAEEYIPTGEEGSVIVARLDISNPWILQDHIQDFNEDPGQTYFDVVSQAGGGEKFRRLLIEQGYDGVVVRGMTTNYYGEGAYDMYVVFNSSQVEVLQVIGEPVPNAQEDGDESRTNIKFDSSYRKDKPFLG
jgi:hypothetical protein